MKKVIDGALYNTETARVIGTHSYSNRRDFAYVSETLYKTKSGKYFLYGEGGPASRYSVTIGQNQWQGGEHIEPMSAGSARKWAEENLDADEYIIEFGEPDEAADDKVALNIIVPHFLKSRLEAMRSETGKSISQLITDKISGILDAK